MKTSRRLDVGAYTLIGLAMLWATTHLLYKDAPQPATPGWLAQCVPNTCETLPALPPQPSQ
ncbi:MAG: hypothetical protein EPO06_11145 [Burkholderiaceae bacterium]|nr:MAG: hypothetical protein EPO06_11145 [Burkholderiaceae bacterium]